jgi:hypothetical protein
LAARRRNRSAWYVVLTEQLQSADAVASDGAQQRHDLGVGQPEAAPHARSDGVVVGRRLSK